MKVVNNLGGIIAAATAMSLCASAAYDWGYFRALGISFDESPTVIADHARTGLIVLPFLAVSGTVVLVLELFIRRQEGGMTEEEIESSSKNPEKTAKSRARPYKTSYYISIIIVLMWVLIGESKFLFVAIPILWFGFVLWAFSNPRLVKSVSNRLFTAIYWMLPIFICLHFFGYNVGRSDHEEQSSTHRIHLTNTFSSNGPIDGQLLRAFGQWSLIKDLDGNIAWISQEDVHRIDLLQKHAPFPGLWYLVPGWLSRSTPG